MNNSNLANKQGTNDPVIVTFYGASVTQQRINREGELTGYVPCIIEALSREFPEHHFTFHQLGYGATHFDDAGLIYFADVLATRPDIVVMDWHSTGLSEFSPSAYAYIQTTLLDSGCVVLNCVLPRRRYVGLPERANVKQARYFQEMGAGLVDLYPLIGKEIDIDRCLRDDVHTTRPGAQAYAEVILPYLRRILRNEKLPQNSGDVIPPPTEPSFPRVSKQLLSATLDHRSTLTLSVDANEPFWLIADCRLGPYSPLLTVSTATEETEIPVWDQWCHYERTSLTRLSPRLTPAVNATTQLSIKISPANPPYSTANHLCPPHPLENRKLIISGEIYCIGGDIQNATLSFSD